MVRTKRKAVATLLLLVLMTLSLAESRFSMSPTASAATLLPQTVQHTDNHPMSPYLPLTSFQLRGIDGPYHTSGNLIFGADNSPYLFHGIARDDLEYFCKGDGHYTQQELAYMGLGDTSAQATYYWGANTVRLPLSENFWLYGSPSQNCSPDQYQALVKQIIDILTSLNLNVIINLQWTNAGGHSTGAGDAWSMPDTDSRVFWQQVAVIYKDYDNVLFELFNEPHLFSNSWTCWRNGCLIMNDNAGRTGHDRGHFTYQAVGMQTLLDTVRKAGANNLAIVGGIGWGFDLSQIPTYHLDGINIVYDTHPYPYTGKQPINWDTAFGTVSATYPVISAESGEYDCKTGFMSQLINYFDAHNIGWIGWAWLVTDGNPCYYPQLVSNYTGKPVSGMGTWEYQRLKAYLNILANEEVPIRRK
jgi:endoglucanase